MPRRSPISTLFPYTTLFRSPIVTPMIRIRLQKQISTQLNADLHMGGVYYWFPYGVTVSDAVLVAKDEQGRSEEHTSELQSLRHLVCRLLLEKKKEPSYCK